ncbi:MAG: OmpA family protein [Gammaproteobacteria bacterium]|nr:OmpA family protein [Gammaproteobacteria bacterium]
MDSPAATGGGRGTEGSSFFVDILSAGEVINISACGAASGDGLRFTIYNNSNTQVATTDLASENVSCSDSMDTPLAAPYRFVAPQAGTYRISVDDLVSNRLSRLDISVTADSGTLPDPTDQQGRLWAYSWNMDAGTFNESGATDADIYALVPGGRPDTNFIWKLDLNNFAGYQYYLVANNLGVDKPYSGYSTPNTSEYQNLSYLYPQYLGAPAVAKTQPSNPPLINNARFIDSDGQDLAFSPGTSTSIQDSGTFEFDSDVAGNYAIYIDLNQDGVMGNLGDRILLGNAVTGSNSVSWDGTDVNGNIVSPDRYGVKISVRMGEYHFIANDVETSGGGSSASDGIGEGLTIWSTDISGVDSPVNVFWDDVTILGSGAGGTVNTPGGGLSDTSAGRHTWGSFVSNGLGNNRYIDTYVYGMAGTASVMVEVKTDDTPVTGTDGTITMDSYFVQGDTPNVSVSDADLNILSAEVETIYVMLRNTSSGESEQVLLTETGANTGVFTGTFVSGAPAVQANNDGVLELGNGDDINAVYTDQLDASGATAERTATATVTQDSDGDGLLDPQDPDADGDGIDNTEEGDESTDTDADGIPDYLDTDSDGDGIDDINEGVLDTDGDGIPNYRDPDSDGDGIADAREGVVDSDGDGVVDYLDLDSDNDAISDAEEGDVDTDTDGVADYLDLDADADGILDAHESGAAAGLDANGDGRIDGAVGSNGLADSVETAPDSGIIDYNADGLADTAVDTDGDSLADFRDTDSDADGIDDAVEGSTDTDADGTADFRDTDSDDDGILDLDEGTLDSDGDGAADFRDIDADNDGIPDSDEGSEDTDGDGTPDYLDEDTDNDGIPDNQESGDTDGDGIVDAKDLDSDNDGITDALEGSLDTDGDGVADFRDLDADNDGVTDLAESGVAVSLDANEDGRLDGAVGANGLADAIETAVESGLADYDADAQADTPRDSDGDGVADFRDLDADNDGLADSIEAGGMDVDGDYRHDGFLDANGDGLADSLEGNPLPDPDTDSDGQPDRIDTDADNDGIFDLIESGGSDSDNNGLVDNFSDADGDGVADDPGVLTPAADTDGDGTEDRLDPDADGDGIDDSVEGTVDSDGDGLADFLDTDSDADGIADSDEGTVDTDADGIADFRDTDSDADGIADSDEGTVDTDGDGIADFRDTDSDADGIADSDEGNIDSDGDGVADFRDSDSDGDGIADSDEGMVDTDGDGIADFRDTDSDADGIVDSEEGNVDTDGDGVADFRDSDSDADGIADSDEGAVDTDADGIANFRDADSDGDGLTDALEALADSDADGQPDYLEVDSDADGLADSEEGSIDTDGDGVADFRDIDSDGDGISDREEGSSDTDADGLPDYLDTDSDADGIADSDEGNVDTDGDGVADFRDLDSDADGIPDSDEGNADTDGDGIADFRDLDSDADGIPDSEEGNVDTDGDGIADFRDQDSDADGIADSDEGNVDTDGDGIADFRDQDSDADGIADSDEGNVDNDRDGVADFRDQDSDGDGIPDSREGAVDSDGDGQPDFRDTDSDGDGLADSLESTVDSDGDGIADYLDLDSDNNGVNDGNEDSDNDGILDRQEGNGDSDGDGVADYLDADADNDGIPDRVEGAADTDGDGVADYLDLDTDNDGIRDQDEGAADHDADGIENFRDLDSDNDGLSDLVEAAALGSGLYQSDANRDGRVDADYPVGANGLADHVETAGESGLPAENLSDADGDGVADYLDLDSDNDGITDIRENRLADRNGDGRLNGQSDNAGIMPGMAQRVSDSDADGVPDFRDLDTDNDGLSDVIEAGYSDTDGNARLDDFIDANGDGADDSLTIAELDIPDSDHDAVADYRDLDSDQDGLTDLLESQGADVGNDGRVDDFSDADGNGLDDALQALPVQAVDTDGDGMPDYLDLDSDNDGKSDQRESGNRDLDEDGVVDPLKDSDADGIADTVDVDQTGGVDSDDDGIDDRFDASFIDEIDSDGDGIVDSADADANGDGFYDDYNGEPGIGAALPDSDNNGIPDYQQANADGKVKTGLDGGCVMGDGSGPIDPTLPGIGLLAALMLLRRRVRKNLARVRSVLPVVLSATLAVASLGQAPHADAAVGDEDPFKRRPYAGVGLGMSQLEPDASGIGGSVDDKNDIGGHLTLGMDLHQRVSAELQANWLGTSTLRPAGEIDYTVYSLSGIFYGLNKRQPREQRLDWSAYLRAGLGSMDNSGTVDFERQNDYHLLLGLGAEYGFKSGFALRGEYIHYDTDAAFAGLSALYRFGSRKDKASTVAPVKTAVIGPVVEPVVEAPVTPAPEPVPVVQVVDADHDGVNDENDHCPGTLPGKPVNAVGCDMFDGVMEGVNFESGSASLTAEARAILDDAADTLRAYPQIRLAISAHTDNQGDAAANMQLSKQRVISVARYLIERGVDGKRIKAMAFGESRPIARNDTPEGRAKNRRVEFRTLDEQSQ